MSVYVDDMYAAFGRMKMCHMVADTSDELLAMAERIGVDPKWIQQRGTAQEHFDVCTSKRILAVKAGAIEITWRDCGRFTYNRAMGHDNGWLKARYQPGPVQAALDV